MKKKPRVNCEHEKSQKSSLAMARTTHLPRIPTPATYAWIFGIFRFVPKVRERNDEEGEEHDGRVKNCTNEIRISKLYSDGIQL
jgi:hypothetical protein